MGVVADIADDVAVMYGGNVVEVGEVEPFSPRRRIPIRVFCWRRCRGSTVNARPSCGPSRYGAGRRNMAGRLPLPQPLPARRRALRRGAALGGKGRRHRPSRRLLAQRQGGGPRMSDAASHLLPCATCGPFNGAAPARPAVGKGRRRRVLRRGGRQDGRPGRRERLRQVDDGLRVLGLEPATRDDPVRGPRHSPSRPARALRPSLPTCRSSWQDPSAALDPKMRSATASPSRSISVACGGSPPKARRAALRMVGLPIVLRRRARPTLVGRSTPARRHR